MKKRYFITGVSRVDPYTQIYMIPKIIVNEITEDNREIKRKIDASKDSNIPKELKASDTFIDGSMLNILRKYIRNCNPITDIYIYLTKDMNEKKEIYTKSIEILYEQLNKELKENERVNPNIVFYPNDFYKDDYENRLRSKDVQKFASYYKEIFEIYSKIRNEQGGKKEIILNIASGTPAFKADMMLMAVSNNLLIEQTANYINDNNLEEYVKEHKKEYGSLMTQLQKANENYENGDVKIVLESRPISTFVYDNLENEIKCLNGIESNLNSRASTESIEAVKRVMLLESVEDGIAKKDYCGVYNSIKDNKQYLVGDENDPESIKSKLLEISKNLYYRYIGDEDGAEIGIRHNKEKLEKYYPIYKLTSIDEKVKGELNAIIEKSNIMRIKSQREEINDWLLISTPLIEAISTYIVTKKVNFNFKEILDKEKKISLKKFDEIAKNKRNIKIYRSVVEKSDNNFLNAIFYKNIIQVIRKNTSNQMERVKLNKMLDYIYLVDYAREARVSAAHSIQNISKAQFEEGYKKLIEEKPIYIKNIAQNYITNQRNESIKCVEDAIKKLIKEELLPDGNAKTIEYFNESINIYETLEKEILKLLKEEIYN